MINERFFSEKVEDLKKAFPNFPANSAARLKRYKAAINDLPEEAIDSIINTMLDNFSHTPLPKDFFDAALAWKRANKVYDGQAIEVTPIECVDCYHTGYLFMRMEMSAPETVAFCHCPYGDQAQKFTDPLYDLLRWEKGNFDRVFIKSVFPVAWFKPSREDEAKGLEEIRLWDKVKLWNQKIKDSHDYYKMRAEKNA